MLPQCVKVVQAAAQAAGRKPLTKAELKRMDDELSSTMSRLARNDPNWPAMTSNQRWDAAAKTIIAQIEADAKRVVENGKRQILAQAQTDNRIALVRAATKGASLADATKRDFANTHNYIRQVRNEAMSSLMDTIEAVGDKTGAGFGRRVLMNLFDAENPVMARDLISEVYAGANGASGNKIAQSGARAWLDTIEKMRTRFNSSGGDVGKLEYGWVPRSWDAERLRKTGRDQFAADMLTEVDRSRMLTETGQPMSDAEVLDFLRYSWDTLSTEGVIHQTPGDYTSPGKRANRGSDHRLIHFKDGEADLRMRQKYGRGGVFEAMSAHISGMARNVGLLERYGPDPNATARLRFDMISKAAGKPYEKAIGALEIDPKTYWNIISGVMTTPHSERIANVGQTLRNIQTFGKLGGAVISSMTDLATVAVTTGYNRMSYFELLKDVGRQAGSKDARDWMATQQIVAENLVSGLDRFGGEMLGQNWSGKLANATMKLSLMNRWSDSLRQGFNMALSHKLADMAKTDWGALTEFDRARLQRSGLSEADWQELQKTTPAKYGDRDYLTPGAVQDRKVAAKLGSFIIDEGEFAVVNPDIRTRTLVTGGGLQSGTAAGEIARTVTQFKSFPIAMISRHWGRMLEGGAPGGPMLANRAAYGFAMLASLTALGAVVTQTKQMLQGKDPIDMTGDHAGRFWMKAMAQGGGWGILGDLFLIDPASSFGDSATTLVKNIAGPTVGTAAEIIAKDITENAWQAADGKETHAGAEFFRTAQSLTPGVGVWWVKPFLEHGLTHAMQENMSPGYLARMKQRARKDWGQRSYWWAPGEMQPDRPPNIGAAVGQN